QVVLKSEDRGQSWTAISPDLTRNDPEKQGTTGGPIMIEGAGGEHYGTLMYIAESPHDAGTLWTGSDDGRVFVTRDGGGEWDNVTPRGLPEAQVNAIEVSPHDPAVAYIAVTRYKFNDFTPTIYRTDDYGHSWDLIVDGIGEEAFARVVREDPVRRGLLYAGTEAGMYVSFNDGDDWQPLQLNLPRVPITDLKVHEDDLVAATQGRAFWILDDITPLRQLDGDVKGGALHLFAPADAYRLDGSGWGEEQAKNPPDGAVIDYLVNDSIKERSGELELAILTDDGEVIRTFTNAEPEKKKETLVKGVQGEPPPPPLGAKGGMNRYVWNLRYERYEPVSDTIRYVSTRPPRVAPGTYQARLTFRGESLTRSFRVLPDPRLEPRSPAEWAEQQRVLHEMIDLVNEIHAATMQMRGVIDQTHRMMKLTASRTQSEAIREGGNALVRKIEAWESQVPQPSLPNDVQDRIAFPSRLLSTQVLHLIGDIDQYPPLTEAAKRRSRELEEQWAELAAGKRDILDGDLRRFNALLEDSGVPHVVAASP
ncbi:MAG TPA: hypothetical protein VE175_08630, partial [Woeseiaceae bacterium]|nr:hypothetical protein [Woeseiaceae bacterium]